MICRVVVLMLTGSLALLMGCASEGQRAGEDEQAPSMSAATEADGYVARAEQFAQAAHYDSALVYFAKAGALYEADTAQIYDDILSAE